MNRQTAGEKLTALYSRLSRDDESIGDSLSIQNQKAMLEKYAAGNGFSNIAHFCDDGFSGGNFDRPDWKRLIEEIDKGNVGTVIAKDMSRIGRDYLQTGFYTEVFFREKGIRFIAIANNIDSQNKESGEFAPFLNIMSEWYLRDASRKVKASHRARGMSGKRLTFKAIYGYMPDPQDKEKWITDPEAAEIVKRIFALTLEGKGPTQIARVLHDEKVERASYHLYQKGIVNYADTYDHSNPYAWSASTIAHIIERPETWETAQRLRKTVRRTDHGEANPLTGVVFCADCGAKLHNHRMPDAKPYINEKGYHCTRAPKDIYVCSTYNLTGRRFDRKCTTHRRRNRSRGKSAAQTGAMPRSAAAVCRQAKAAFTAAQFTGAQG